MKIYLLDKKIEKFYYNSIDSEIMYSHSDSATKGRLYIMTEIVYRGEKRKLAIPFTGELKSSKVPEQYSVPLDIKKQDAKSNGGLYISKSILVEDRDMLKADIFKKVGVASKIANQVDHLSRELSEKVSRYIGEKECGKSVRNSTNLDRQNNFLKARTIILSSNYSEEYLYSLDYDAIMKLSAQLQKTNASMKENFNATQDGLTNDASTSDVTRQSASAPKGLTATTLEKVCKPKIEEETEFRINEITQSAVNLQKEKPIVAQESGKPKTEVRKIAPFSKRGCGHEKQK